MKWIGGISFSSRVTGKVVIAVMVFILWQILTIESSAQTASAVFKNVETDWIRSRDPAPEVFGLQTGQTVKIEGGILNLGGAFIVALRETRIDQLTASGLGELGEPGLNADLSAASDSAATGADDKEGDDEEKSKPKAPPDKPQEWPQDWRPDFFQPLPDHALDQDLGADRRRTTFDWNAAFRQSMFFLAIEHAFRLATEDGTRADLKGPFFKDYFRAMRSLRGWDDGDPFLVNYIGHPMAGSVAGFIQVHNDPKGVTEKVSLNKNYWRSRLKAFGWSFAYSTQFELGLFSEASLGNIGIRPYGKAKHPMAYVDLVVTPVVGTGWLVGEDMLDHYLVRPLEDRIGNRALRLLIRTFLNPTRSFANFLRGQKPWYRDNR
jgi:hypothetical protein